MAFLPILIRKSEVLESESKRDMEKKTHISMAIDINNSNTNSEIAKGSGALALRSGNKHIPISKNTTTDFAIPEP